MNTFGFCVSACNYLDFNSLEQLREAFVSGAISEPWYVLSGGSNVLFSGDYPGTILHSTSTCIALLSEDNDTVTLRADAGVVWDDFVGYCVQRGWYGVENLSLIPGYVGASPVQNIGAYGREVKDVVCAVEAYLPQSDRVIRLSNAECRFDYRDSIFKQELRGQAIVTSVEFVLQKNGVLHLDYGDIKRALEPMGEPTLARVREAIIGIRSSKLPDPKVTGNVGSFFKNPVVAPAVFEALLERHPDLPSYPAKEGVKIPAGWLIERAGWKGHRMGDAGVHAKQALVLVNHGGCTGADILHLADCIVADVRSKFGIEIEKEVNVL